MLLTSVRDVRWLVICISWPWTGLVAPWVVRGEVGLRGATRFDECLMLRTSGPDACG